MKQLELINKVQNLANSTDDIRAVFMYGSFIKGEGDKFSDIEFYIFVKDESKFDMKAFVSSVDTLHMFFRNEYGTDVAIYDDLIRAEYHFLNAEKVQIIKSWEGMISFAHKDKMILADKDQSLKNVLDEIKQINPERNTSKNIDWLAQSLVNFTLQTKNLMGRQEWAHAHMSLGNIQRHFLWLLRIKENSTEHWESPTKGLDKDLSKKSVDLYMSITSSADKDDLARAIQIILQEAKVLFRELKVSQDIQNVLSMIDRYKPYQA